MEMTRRLMPICALLLFASALFASGAATSDQDSAGLTVHEWGTFTAVAGEDGGPVQWLALGGPADLPCFVNRATGIPDKSRLWATVRMETPVLYFYSPSDMKVDVSVRFPLGLMTEYFPPAAVRGGSISWPDVRVEPRGSAEFPVEEGTSHYYLARDTAAAPLRVGSDSERFLFYRGVGSFPLPIAATIAASGDVIVTNQAGQPVGHVVLFENHRGAIGYRVVDLQAKTTTIRRSSARTSLSSLTAELEQLLTSRGLFPKEAAAMVATWRESWFEEGTRLLYVMPSQAVDAVLPLRINQRPADLVRVFVGRLELITPELLEQVSQAARQSDWTSLSKIARFLHPITDRISAASTALDRVVVEQRLRSAAASFGTAVEPSTCSK
jgi:hypothetical protein